MKRFITAFRVIGGVMAGVVFLLGLLATNRAFHDAAHHDGNAASVTCVLCLLAKGQVDSPQLVSVITPAVQHSFEAPGRWQLPAVLDFRYVISPSRAPPAAARRFSVVA